MQPFEINVNNCECVKKKCVKHQSLTYLEPFEFSECVMEAFDWPKTNSDFDFYWGQKNLKPDIYGIASSLDDWLDFVNWLQTGINGKEHFDPWTSSFQMSFDVIRRDEALIRMQLTSGSFFEDREIPNIIEIRPEVVIGELGKLFHVVQHGLSNSGKKYFILDKILDKIAFLPND